MLDFVSVAMVIAIPAFLFGARQAMSKNYRTHKLIMTSLSAILLTAVALFEYEMRTIGWEHLAEPSPYFGETLDNTLYIHLFFSVSTAVSLLITVGLAFKKFSRIPKPNSHSYVHRIVGRVSIGGLIMTSITGWIFYWMAFVAT